ncbi:large neutral amino acids transporter small subunit 1-like isoform X2 [Haliotis rufescens]|uniref:large neutral amino acids transporter small subunit 1-like isoform X2 n=1 Tax=Haliotis rufescens TaxID=6454 RepID=UPI00201F3904|nr:large neutral amino acids transporter small subunit 1-like isoform X2 [Haliotis rufescens]
MGTWGIHSVPLYHQTSFPWLYTSRCGSEAACCCIISDSDVPELPLHEGRHQVPVRPEFIKGDSHAHHHHRGDVQAERQEIQGTTASVLGRNYHRSGKHCSRPRVWLLLIWRQVITILMEEVKDPIRNVPRSLSLTFVTVIILYTVTNFSYCVVLSMPEMLESNAVAVTFGYHLHPTLSVVISVLVALSCVSTLNVLILGQPRMVFAAGCNGHMPGLMGMINRKYLTPWPATFFVSIPALAILFSGSVVRLIDAMSLYTCMMVSSVLIVLLYLRWKKPMAKRPIKMPIILPILELMLSTVLICLSVYQKPLELGLCLAIVAAGIPVYFICVEWKSKPKVFLRFMERSTLFLKTLLYVESPAQ